MSIAKIEMLEAIQEAAVPLTGSDHDFDTLMKRAETTSLVLIGEASHGTHEFYRLRAQITKRLIRELGFNAVAVEADWPDAYRVNRFVRGLGSDTHQKPSAISSDFRNGCGGMPTCSILSAG